MGLRNLEQLLAATNVLHSIHIESAKSEHARQENGSSEWQPYIPTNFIYGFFTFNTLYNIDWGKSLNKGQVRSFPIWGESKVSEADKIENYITFCCQKDTFVESYSKVFVKFVKRYYSTQEIVDVLETIKKDEVQGGNLRNENIINDFKDACKNLLRGSCNKNILKKIVILIYKVRCNLFHGIKTLKVLNESSQKEKLKLYSLLLIAINQMVFSYLNYLKDGTVYDALHNLKSEK